MDSKHVKKKVMTLVYIRNEDKVLLGMKKRGFGEGKWNGFGGKVEPNESILQGAIREVQEECGVDIKPGFLYCLSKKLSFRPQRWRCVLLFCNTTTKRVSLY